MAAGQNQVPLVNIPKHSSLYWDVRLPFFGVGGIGPYPNDDGRWSLTTTAVIVGQ